MRYFNWNILVNTITVPWYSNFSKSYILLLKEPRDKNRWSGIICCVKVLHLMNKNGLVELELNHEDAVMVTLLLHS